MRKSCGILTAVPVIGLICLIATSAPAQVKQDQLVGTWVAVAPANISGFEFTAAGKVTMYYGGANEGMTGDYSIAGDGRLGVGLGGLTQFFVPNMAADQLQLKEPDSGAVSQYRKLKPGETMAAAIAAQDADAKKTVAQRNAAIPAFLARNDLVMIVVNGGANCPLSNCTLQLSGNGADYTGRALFDTKPPHVDVVGAQMQGSPDNPSVVIWFGPGSAQQNKGSYIFHASGSADNITLVSHVSFRAFGDASDSTLIIKPDAAMQKQVLEGAKAEASRANELKTPVQAMLKDYVVLKGTSQSTLPAERAGYVDEFILSRNLQNGVFTGQARLVNHTTGQTDIFPVMAGVGIAGNKPVFQIASQKRVYQFNQIDTAGGKFSGAWQVPQNPNGHMAELTISQALDAKGRDQLFADSKKSLSQLGAATVYHAVIIDQNSNGQQPPNPVAVTLTAGAGGAFTGKVEYPLQGCTITLSGKLADTPLGPQLLLKYAAGQTGPGAWGDAPAFLNAVQNEAWLLSPAGNPSGPMRLSGYGVINPRPGNLPFTVELIPYTDKDKAAITQALAGGVSFKVLHPVMDGPDDIMTFSADAAGKITGSLSGPGHKMNTAPNSKYSGEVKDQSDYTEMDLLCLRPGNSPAVYAHRTVITPLDDGLYITGYVYNIRMTAARPLGHWDGVAAKP